MKVCRVCGNEYESRDGDNTCPSCENAPRAKQARARQNRKAREAAYESCGLVKVRGAMGGTYWE